jgi:hypothetical protein
MGSHLRGESNSSLTRVRPIFQSLINRDHTGLSWLPKILGLSTENLNLAVRLSEDSSELLKTTEKKRYPDRVLRKYGIPDIELETCFEKPFPPPRRFLKWLIENPDRMIRRESNGRKETLEKRGKLFEKFGPALAQEARRNALQQLTLFGPARSQRKWWAFEGFTEVDCCLETERMVLFLEGKWKEMLSPSTKWFKKRNQLIRNLEVAQEAAGNKEFGVMVIAETGIGPIPDKITQEGLPHFTMKEREVLMGHYLGCILWSDLCRAVGIDYEKLPKSLEEILETLRCPLDTAKILS